MRAQAAQPLKTKSLALLPSMCPGPGWLWPGRAMQCAANPTAPEPTLGSAQDLSWAEVGAP